MSTPIEIDKRRRIIQISTAQSETANRTSSVVYALCDDGTLWMMQDSYRWFMVDEVPQPMGVKE